MPKTKKKSVPVKRKPRQADPGEAALKIGMGSVVAILIMTVAAYAVTTYKPAASESSFYQFFIYLAPLAGALGSATTKWAKSLLGGSRSDLFYAVTASAVYAVILSIVLALVGILG